MSRGVEASTAAGVERCVRASWVLRARALVEETKIPKHPGPANGVFSP